jgi:hypothetical protein
VGEFTPLATATSDAALWNAGAASSDAALGYAGAAAPDAAVGTAVLDKHVDSPLAMDALAQFQWAFERALGYGAPADIGLVLLMALPTTEEGRGELRRGFDEGTLDGFKDGFDSLVDTLAWIRDASFSLLALAVDFELGEELGRALAIDLINGVDPLEGKTAALLDQRYPILLGIARGCALLIALRGALEEFIVSSEEGSFFKVLGAANVTVARLLGQELKEFVDEFVSLTREPRQQGAMVGRFYGRLGFEVMVEVMSLPVKPAAAPIQGGRAAVIASKAAKNLAKIAPEILTLVIRRFSIPDAMRAGKTLERALFEAYQELNRMTGRHGDVQDRTLEFNKFYKTLAAKLGWTSKSDVLGFDSHHVIEKRILKHKKFLKDPGFQDAFKRLGWSSDRDMLAIPLETEFHRGKGSTLAKRLDAENPLPATDPKLADEPVIADLKSLSVELLAKLGNLDQYHTFQQLLDAYEAIYRAPIAITLTNGAEFTTDPLWTKVEPAFEQIRQTLGLPEPPAPVPKIPNRPTAPKPP